MNKYYPQQNSQNQINKIYQNVQMSKRNYNFKSCDQDSLIDFQKSMSHNRVLTQKLDLNVQPFTEKITQESNDRFKKVKPFNEKTTQDDRFKKVQPFKFDENLKITQESNDRFQKMINQQNIQYKNKENYYNQLNQRNIPQTARNFDRKQQLTNQNIITFNFISQSEKGNFKFDIGYKINQNKINQDNFLIINDKDMKVFGVYDGHGENGHAVSEVIAKSLKLFLQKSLLKFQNDPVKSLQMTYFLLQKQLELSEIDIQHSGSTAVTIYIQNNQLYIANSGDSRAIMKQKDKIVELTVDQKPSLLQEQKRIVDKGGFIEQSKDQYGNEVGPLRVWDSQNKKYGIAMTRSIGDQLVKNIGVTWEPEITKHEFSNKDQYLIIASDGLWDVISNEECVEMIQPYYENNDLDGAIELLIQESKSRWQQNYNNQLRDDITIILIYLKQ